MCPEAATAEWIFPQEKSTFKDAKKATVTAVLL
jgi:hypothetical protein